MDVHKIFIDSFRIVIFIHIVSKVIEVAAAAVVVE
jgi:hypothetical protein